MASTGKGISVSGMGKENLAAFRWKIPLHEWWSMPHHLRIAHLAAVEVSDILANLGTGDKDG